MIFRVSTWNCAGKKVAQDIYFVMSDISSEFPFRHKINLDKNMGNEVGQKRLVLQLFSETQKTLIRCMIICYQNTNFIAIFYAVYQLIVQVCLRLQNVFTMNRVLKLLANAIRRSCGDEVGVLVRLKYVLSEFNPKNM